MENDILLGVSGGLLSLVGLIAIFISINSQHSIEKAREILLELELFRIENPETNILTAKKLRYKFDQYRKLINVSIPTIIVIFIAISTIIFVGTSWYYYLGKIIFVKISLLFIGLFALCLVLLTRVSFIGALPRYKVFKDINTIHKGIKMSDLFSLSLQSKIKLKNKNLHDVSFHSPLEVDNIKGVSVLVSYLKDDKSIYSEEYNEFQIRRGTDFQMKNGAEINEFSPKSIVEVQNLKEVPVSEYTKIVINLHFGFEKGDQSVTFKIDDIKDTKIARDPRTLLTPSCFSFYDGNYTMAGLKNWEKTNMEYDFTDTLTKF